MTGTFNSFLKDLYSGPTMSSKMDDSWIHNEDVQCDMRREAIRMFLDLQGVPEDEALHFMDVLDYPDSEEVWVLLNELLTMDGTPFLELNCRELGDMKGRFLAHAFIKEANKIKEAKGELDRGGPKVD